MPNYKQVAPLLKKRMLHAGTLMVTYQPMETFQLPNFFRITTHCVPPPSAESMRFILDELERLGADIQLTDLEEELTNNQKAART